MKIHFQKIGSALLLALQLYTNQLAAQTQYSSFSKSPAAIRYGEHSTIAADATLTALSAMLKMQEGDQLIPIRTETDRIGFTHRRHQQYYHHIKVEGGHYITHEKNGRLYSANGHWIENIELSPVPRIPENQALQAALQHTNAQTYKWEVPSEEAFIKMLKNDPHATFYPKGELAIVAKDFDYTRRDLRLCYKFDLFSHEPAGHQCVFIDAANAEVVATVSKSEGVDVPATANTFYSGTRNLTTDMVSVNNYRLRETNRGNGIETYDMNTGTNYGAAVDFTNTSTVWNTTTNYDNAAYDIHWGMETTYDYFLNVHGRNSVDNAGMVIRSYVHYGVNQRTAGRLTDATFYFGDGNLAYGEKPYAALDICAHEFTHGVTQFSAGLHYGGESSALNEAFSDMLGIAVDFYARPATANFKIADEVFVNGTGCIRNLADPNQNTIQHPDTYHGNYWYAGLLPEEIAHRNATVAGHWFYLLCQGGSGTNDIGNSFNISPIGLSKAEKIAYRTLVHYLTPFSSFADARMFSIQATEDLYGVCSPEVIAVTNAWYAVGVGTVYTAGAQASFTSNGSFSCNAPFTVHFENTSVNATTAQWLFGDGNSSTDIHPSHTYNTPGTYTVRLTAGGSCGSDVEEINAYITIAPPNTPTVTGANACGASSLTLSANGSGILQWYNSSTGGTSIYTGTTFNTPILSNTTTYYVENKIAGSTGTVGASTWLAQYGNTYAQYVSFDVLQACTLKTVTTYSYAATTRHIILRDNMGNILQDLPITLPVGQATIALNFPLEPGIGYELGGESLSFAFDNTNTAYPYTLPGVASIKGNTVSNAIYLFFYNWQFETAACVSARVPVTATINASPTVIYDASAYSNIYTNTPPFMLTGGSPLGGTYSGIGVNANVFDPSIAGVGSHLLQYSYTDANGCSNISSQTIHVTMPAALSATISGTGLCSGSCNASATAVVTGGVMPYSYIWSNGSTQSALQNLCAGTYMVTVADALGTTATASIVHNAPSVALSATITKTNIQCYGVINGTATATPLGGTAPYTYLWNNGQLTATATGLAQGYYTVTATDANGCTVKKTILVTAPSTIVINKSSVATSCAGSNGTATVSATGGTGSKTFVWSNGATTATISGLTAGNYTVTATDANGCQKSATVTVANGCAATISQTNVSCNGVCNGSASVLINGGGTPPYSYHWSNNAGGSNQANVTGLCAGTYYVTVTDNGGIVNVLSTVITQPAVLSATINKQNATCTGACNGIAYATVSGAAAPYSYQWSNGATTTSATGLCAGSYSVTITSSTGCTLVKTFLILDNALSLSTSSTPAACSPNGTATVAVSGTGVAPYSYLWSNGGTTASISGLAAAVYRVTVTDANGCAKSAQVSVGNSCLGLVDENTAWGGYAAPNLSAVEVLVEPSLLVYPNPNDGIFYLQIEVTTAQNIQVQVQNVLGQIVHAQHLQGQQFLLRVDATRWASGTYLVQVIDSNQQQIIRTIIRQ